MATTFNTSVFDPHQAARAAAAATAFAAGESESIEGLFIEQLYEAYTAEDHAAWRTLYQQQERFLEKCASRLWLSGAAAIGLSAPRIPRLIDINTRLNLLTGWRSRAVPGYVSARPFFACIAQATFPTTIVIRPGDHLAYIPEPDIFHDVFGHVPLHADPVFASFLQDWGKAALRAPAEDTERLARLFWYTVEFGLIREEGQLKIYGAGLISSPEESHYALESKEVERRPFDWRQMCELPFEIDHKQPVLFVLDSFQQLISGMRECAAELGLTGCRCGGTCPCQRNGHKHHHH